VSLNEENEHTLKNTEGLLLSAQQEAIDLHSKVADQNIRILRLEAPPPTPEKPPPPLPIPPSHDMLLKVSELERATEDLHVENERLNVRYKAKAQRVEEVQGEISRLREELEARMMDLDALRIKDQRGDEVSKAVIFQLEADLSNLRQVSELQEIRRLEQNSMLMDSDEALELAQSESLYLRDVLAQVGKKDEVSGRLLIDSSNDREVLRETVNRASKDLQAKQYELEESRQEREKLERDVHDTVIASEQAERTFEDRRFQVFL
jgi:hypothetical protein